MQVKIVVLAIAMLLQHSVSGQSLTALTDIIRPDMAPNSLPVSFYSGQKKKMGASTIVGISAMGAGCISLILGLGAGMQYQDSGFGSSSTTEEDERREKIRNNFYVGGGILLAAGAGLLINGIIHDVRHSRRFSVVSPKPNQLGLAFNF